MMMRILLLASAILAVALPASAQFPETVHPAYDLVNLRPTGFEPKGIGGMDFLSDGSMVICTWGGYKRSQGEVYIVSGISGTAAGVRYRKIAQGLAEPMGLKVVNDTIFVMQRTELSRILVPPEGSLAAPQKAAGDWADPTGDWTYGLAYKDGAFFGTQGQWDPGQAKLMTKDRGSWLKLVPGKPPQDLASGLRNANGIVAGPDGEFFATDNQGTWLPASKLIHLVPGRFYGCKNNPQAPFLDQPETPPAVWVPYGEIGFSPTEPVLVPGGTYRGQLLAGDIHFGGMQRYFLEKVAGADGTREYQGCVFRFSGGFECGINRLRFGPDGSLYAGGAGGSADLGDLGGWNWNNKWTGLQKLVPNGKVPFDLLAVRALSDGFELEFTQPLALGAEAAANFTANHWRYVPTSAYGGPKVDAAGLSVLSVSVAPGRKRARLRVGGLRPGFVVHIRIAGVKSDAGEALLSNDAWYTLNEFGPPEPVDDVPRLLVYSRTLDYRHAVIPDADAAVMAMGKRDGYAVDTTEDPTAFTPENLARYRAVFFNHADGDILDSSQQAAFQGFIRKGGGFAGIHAASYALTHWAWFGGLIGAYFKDHSNVVPATVRIEDKSHPSTAGLPAAWNRTDEWYNFTVNPRANVKVLMTVDETTYTGGKMGADHPIAWYHAYDGGRVWYSALGHTPESYRDSLYLSHLRGGLAYAMGLPGTTALAPGPAPHRAAGLRLEAIRGKMGFIRPGREAVFDGNGRVQRAAHR